MNTLFEDLTKRIKEEFPEVEGMVIAVNTGKRSRVTLSTGDTKGLSTAVRSHLKKDKP